MLLPLEEALDACLRQTMPSAEFRSDIEGSRQHVPKKGQPPDLVYQIDRMATMRRGSGRPVADRSLGPRRA